MTRSPDKQTKVFIVIAALTAVIASIAYCGRNTVESNNHRIMKQWCAEQEGEFQTKDEYFPHNPDRCMITVTKGLAKIEMGTKSIPLKSRVVNYDTGEREVIALTDRKWIPSEGSSGGYGRGYFKYTEVHIGSYILTNAPES